MVYKRVIKKNGKEYEYYYENFRDENGVVRNRFLGSKPPRRKFNRFLLIFIPFLIVLLFILIYTTYLFLPYDLTGLSVSSIQEGISEEIVSNAVSSANNSKILNEGVKESFEKEGVVLEIKIPNKVLNQNENERMDFRRERGC